MGGAARDGEAERDRAGLHRHDLQAGRLGDDRGVGDEAGADRGEHPGPAVLLGRNGQHDRLPCEVGGVDGGADSGQGREHGDEATLHVAGTASVDVAVAQLRAEGVQRPAAAIAGRDHVRVAGQEQARARPRAPEGARGERQAGARHLRSGVVGVGREGDGVGVPGADREAEGGHPPCHGVSRCPSSPVTDGIATSSRRSASIAAGSTAAAARAARAAVAAGMARADCSLMPAAAAGG